MAEELIPPSPSQEHYEAEQDQGDAFSIRDPFALFADWLVLAGKTEPNDPNAMALATVDSGGTPNVRIVLLKDVSACGLTFHTNIESAKGLELSHTPRAALCFHWKTIRRQVRFRGAVEAVSDAEADEYFASRARGARIGAHASAQSRPLEDRKTLEEKVAEFEKKFQGRDVPRPANWSGYRLVPHEIEFWVNRPFRLHDRLRYRRDGDEWKITRLYP
jgi:pyridoxamine 5'-phosphate oxidase